MLIILLSKNDLDVISTALRRMKQLTLIRTLGNAEMSVSVIPAPPVWTVAMVIQVKVKEHGTEWVQTFESVEKAVEIMCGMC